MEDNKTVNMSALFKNVSKKNESKVPEKPSYEQLKYWLDKTVSDNKSLIAQLNEVTHILTFLPYLFKVVEFKDNFDPEFVQKCNESITSILTPVKRTDSAEDTVKESDANENKGE